MLFHSKSITFGCNFGDYADMRYKDLFIDFDDTLYDTHGNAVIALDETFGVFHLERYFPDPQVFYDAYWWANIDLWGRYSKGEITRDFLIVERFRRPLSEGKGLEITEALCLEMNKVFLDFCSSKPGVIEGAHELMDYLKGRDYFDTIILSEDAGANKPSTAFFDYALRQSGASRETTLMIGDNLQTDILGALHAGIDALLFNRWEVDVDEAPQTPTYVVSSLREIIHRNLL